MIQKYITKSVFRPLLYNELALSIKSESFDKGKSPDEEGYPEKKGCLIIVKNEAEANKLRYLLESLQPSHKIAVFTDNDSLIGDSYNFFSAEQLASSFKILQNLLDCKSLDKKIVILPYRSAITPIKNIAKLSKKYQVLTLSKNRDYKFDQIIERLVELGYKRTDLAVSTAQFAVRGGIIDIVEASSNKAFRLDFFGDKLDEISSYNTLTQRSMKFDEIDGPQGKIKDLKIQQIKDLKIWPIVNFFETQKTGKKSLIEYFIPTYKLVIPDYELLQTFEKDFQDFAQLGLAENGQKFSDYYFSMAELFAKISKTPVKQLNNNANSSIILVSPFEANFANFQMSNALFENKVFEDKVIEKIYKPNISQKTLNFLENLPYTYEASQFKAIRQKKNIINPMQLTKGDILVHERYGIGKYLGLTKRYLEVNDFENNNFEKPYQEYIEIAYAPNARLKTSQIKYGITSKTSDYDRLLVSTSDLSQVTKYIGHDNPRLSELGSAHWKKARRAARRLAREITEQLVSVYSKRLAIQGFSYLADTQEQKNFEDEFKFVETPDQIKTAEVVKADMESEYPMDRLICGDVGYGKTEIALRAAFKAVDNAKQVAILAPTTLLVNQHYETCLKRFKNTAFRIEYLSRFQSAKKTKKIIEDTKLGKVDILIGTHKLLSDKISYFSLGLIIIDEEQRFGVSQKEKLRQINP
ncbi:MAG: DEAD/DEAH box helicase, partial [Bifidobacteriaceae bacterium]|nr:DEAD/DEAH box helicase [Bifidobacteriaceae bacterium]